MAWAKPAAMEATRTLLKSTPELWAEVSDPSALGRHLEVFGAIRITRLEPGSMVVWEGDRATGEVRLASTGLGTRVTLVADEGAGPDGYEELEDLETATAPAATVPSVADPAPAVRPVLLARLRSRLRLGRTAAPVVVALDLDLEPEPDPPGPEQIVEWRFPRGPDEGLAVLTGVLDALGAAHRRPFSRT